MPKPIKEAPTRNRTMPKRPSSDPILRARQQMAEHMEKAETSDAPWKDNPAEPAPTFAEQLSAHMSKLGAKGGKIGGKRRMGAMKESDRSALALKAATARWTKDRAKKKREGR